MKSFCIAAIIASCVVSNVFCQELPNPPHDALTPRNDLPGLKNFAKVSEALFRGEQPTAEGFTELKKLGVKTIVCLREFHGDRDLLKGVGLQYAHINCKAWHPEDEDVARFIKIVRDPKNQPVFVHCQHGSDRTGVMVGCYRIMEMKWTNTEAEKEIHNFGYHEIFKDIQTYLLEFDPAKMSHRIEKTDAVKIDYVP